MFIDSPDLLATEVATGHLLGAETREAYGQYLHEAIGYVQEFLNREGFYSGIAPESLRDFEPQIAPDGQLPTSVSDALRELKQIYLDHTIAFHHPTYVAHLNCPVVLPALVGDLIASAVNTAVETWDQSTSATLIEQALIGWINGHLHLPQATADGVFTPGGTQSNLMGMLMARDHFAYTRLGVNLKERGATPEMSRFRIFCSDKAHFSLKKSAALLGMGYEAVVPVATDERMKMRPEALRRALDRELAAGNMPIAVVATMGTTDFGSMDPIEAIAPLANEYGLWLHVDGAYGGCYVLTETHRHLFEGVQHANSVTIDFHKTLFQPVASSAFLVRDRAMFRYVAHYADYLNPHDAEDELQPNLVEKSLQTTRRFDALKLWMTLKVVGERTLASYLETVHHLAAGIYPLLVAEPCFEPLHDPELSTLVFRYCAPGVKDDAAHDEINLRIKNTLFRQGKASVASTRFNGKRYLKFTLLNPQVTHQDLVYILDLIKETATEVVATLDDLTP